MEEKPRLLILYASQTGNAEDAAERIGREAERRHCNSVVLSVEDFDVRLLPYEELVVFVVSTTGQGDPPNSMKEFWKFLLMRSLGHLWLEGTNYALFGLGDSGYQKFNIVAKKLDKRLSDLGAHLIIERGLGDDQHRSGYEAALDPWLTSLWATIEKKFPNIFGQGAMLSDTETKFLDLPKFQITYHDHANAQLIHESFVNEESVIQDKLMDCLSVRAMIEAANSANKPISKPNNALPTQCFARIIENKRLTGEDYERDVRHIEFDLGCSGIQYEVGDVLEVMPSQTEAAVDAFIERCCLDPNAYITVEGRKPSKYSLGSDTRSLFSQPVKLKTIVESTMDIASASPQRYFFEIMSHFATAEHEKERLQYFASLEGRDDLYQYNQKERRTVIEALEDFPSVHLPLEWLLQLVPRLRTRMFSISSSLLAHPNQVHITVAVVSWMTPFKRKRYGLCSSWLAGLDPRKEKILVPTWFHRGELKPPPPATPLVLVGPGTGCAPFRAFIQQKSVLRVVEPAAPIIFFFGCRNEAKDFLYKDFWLSNMANCGVLSQERGGGFFVAFSRDQEQKVYVQHKMQEESSRVWNILKSGAWVYVAGSAAKMPTDVMSALEEIIAREGGFSKESAARWLRQLEKVGMVSLALMDKVLHVDLHNNTVQVQAGLTVSNLVDHLRPYGLTLQNFASIREQQIGGFTQVGAHGTGARLPPVDEQVVSIKLVTPGKGTIDLSAENDPDLFYLARCGLGGLGIVAEITLQCVPRHQLVEHTFVSNIKEIRKMHKKWLVDNKHLRYMWIPYTDTIVVVQCNCLPEGEDPPKFSAKYGKDEALQHLRDLYKEHERNHKIEETSSVKNSDDKPSVQVPSSTEVDVNELSFTELRDKLLSLHPLDKNHVMKINFAEAEYWKKSEGYRVGWSDEILGFDCGGQQWVSEVCFPVGTLTKPNLKDINYVEEAIKLINNENIPAPAPIEQRWTACSRSSMSPASCTIPDALFSWVGIIMYMPTVDSNQRKAITSEFFKYRYATKRHLWDKYSAYEHWAKIEIPDNEEERTWLHEWIKKYFPVESYNRARTELDPNHILSNDFLEKLFPLPVNKSEV